MKAEKGKIIAVWGSPASGKSTFAVKLATAIYDNFESTVIVLFTDLETPMIPVIFPNDSRRTTARSVFRSQRRILRRRKSSKTL